jgi:hypothetical protein
MTLASDLIALSVLIGLAVMAAIYTTVFGASAGTAAHQAGSHLVSGAKVSLDHYREANPAPAPLQSGFQNGHDCNSDRQPSLQE